MLYDSYTYIFNYWRSAPIIENISKVLPIRKITNEYGKRFIQFYLCLENNLSRRELERNIENKGGNK